MEDTARYTRDACCDWGRLWVLYNVVMLAQGPSVWGLWRVAETRYAHSHPDAENAVDITTLFSYRISRCSLRK